MTELTSSNPKMVKILGNQRKMADLKIFYIQYIYLLHEADLDVGTGE